MAIRNFTKREEEPEMTESRKAEICKEYSKCYQNMLSSHDRIEELRAEVERAGMKFNMINYSSYMMPNFMGEPKFELVMA